MHVLITGAGGYVGAFLTEFLLSHGHQVTAVVNSNRGRLLAVLDENKLFRIVKGDLTANLDFLPKKVDAIVHLSARLPLSRVTNDELVRDNVIVTQNIALYANRIEVKKIIFFSSISVYGQITTSNVNELTPIKDPDLYGLTKRMGEMLLQDKKNSFCSLALRLPGIIGPHIAHQNWLSSILTSMREGREVSVYNPKAPFNNAVHISDLNQFILKVFNQKWEGADVVTLSAAGAITIQNVVQLFADVFNSSSIIKYEVATKPQFTISHVRARSLYGYQPMEISKMIKQFADENRNVHSS